MRVKLARVHILKTFFWYRSEAIEEYFIGFNEALEYWFVIKNLTVVFFHLTTLITKIITFN